MSLEMAGNHLTAEYSGTYTIQLSHIKMEVREKNVLLALSLWNMSILDLQWLFFPEELFSYANPYLQS